MYSKYYRESSHPWISLPFRLTLLSSISSLQGCNFDVAVQLRPSLLLHKFDSGSQWKTWITLYWLGLVRIRNAIARRQGRSIPRVRFRSAVITGSLDIFALALQIASTPWAPIRLWIWNNTVITCGAEPLAGSSFVLCPCLETDQKIPQDQERVHPPPNLWFSSATSHVQGINHK
jgi:hypothetical protein